MTRTLLRVGAGAVAFLARLAVLAAPGCVPRGDRLRTLRVALTLRPPAPPARTPEN